MGFLNFVEGFFNFSILGKKQRRKKAHFTRERRRTGTEWGPHPKGQKSGRLCRRPVQSFHSFLLLEGVYSVSNKIPKVLGPQWEAMVQLAVVTWISLKSITSNTAWRTNST